MEYFGKVREVEKATWDFNVIVKQKYILLIIRVRNGRKRFVHGVSLRTWRIDIFDCEKVKSLNRSIVLVTNK